VLIDANGMWLSAQDGSAHELTSFYRVGNDTEIRAWGGIKLTSSTGQWGQPIVLNGNVGVLKLLPTYALDVFGDINCSGALRIAGASVQTNMIGLNASIMSLSNMIAGLSNMMLDKSSGYEVAQTTMTINTDPMQATGLYKTMFQYGSNTPSTYGVVRDYKSPNMITGMGANSNWGFNRTAGYYQNPLSGFYKITACMEMPSVAPSNSGFSIWMRTYAGLASSNVIIWSHIYGTPGKQLSFSVTYPLLQGEIIGVSPYNLLNCIVPVYVETLEYIGPI
jgi:hypothetical protein